MIALALTGLLTAWTASRPLAGDYVAFSLRRAAEIARTGKTPELVEHLGGITDLAGFVLDETQTDVILVGRRRAGHEELALADLVVAMRAMLVARRAPLVSIDKTPETASTGQQTVRYEGGIESTRLAADMVALDILLKELALGTTAGAVWGVPSYPDLTVAAIQADEPVGSVSSRFWFRNQNASYACRDGVFVIQRLEVSIDTEVLASLDAAGQPAGSGQTLADAIGEQFAHNVQAHLDDLAVQYPLLARARSILALVSLAGGMEALNLESALEYWLESYAVPACPTPTQHPLLTARRSLQDKDTELVVSGGVTFDARVIRLQSGEVGALREAVLGSRPAPDELTWGPPLDGWYVPGCAEDPLLAAESAEAPGFSLDTTIARIGAGRAAALPTVLPNVLPPLAARAVLGPPSLAPAFRPPTTSPHVGGVMLSGAMLPAEPGATGPAVDCADGSFALVVAGENATLEPCAFRRFVTALWAVYFDQASPGISIDPIAPGSEKHLVRYIGRVVNTDLGRVMREADYQMKRFWVGTDRPDIRGFPSMDELQARFGIRLLGVSRRCWFVPEAMRFVLSGGALLFSEGRMVLKTEALEGEVEEPSDRAFADAFTQAYHGAMSEKYPIYQELFEYAQLVGFARYLKENGIPLLWFLLAHKELVLTEDSPGTVDALARKSTAFEGLHIEGGVDLAPRCQYVLDDSARTAIARARERAPLDASRPAPAEPRVRSPAAPRFADRPYSVVARGAAVEGRDRHGIRYQTDVALRDGTQPGLEVVRAFDPGSAEAGDFGDGWSLLRPYRVRPANEERIAYRGASLPASMVVESRLGGEPEVLTFDSTRLSIAGYLPDEFARSQVVGLFPTTAGQYRLADKIGNEFHFDAEGELTDMLLSDSYTMHFDYQRGELALEQPPYILTPAGKARLEFRGLSIPMRMQIVSTITGLSQHLRFSDQGRIAGYIPGDAETSEVRILALMTDGSFRLVERDGAEYAFDGSGRFVSLLLQDPIVSAVRVGTQSVEFHRALDASGGLRIVSAKVLAGESRQPVLTLEYSQDDGGRLSRVRKTPAP